MCTPTADPRGDPCAHIADRELDRDVVLADPGLERRSFIYPTGSSNSREIPICPSCAHIATSMRLVRPYVDENRQVIFVELENETAHEVVNGALLALLTIGPIALLVPRPL